MTVDQATRGFQESNRYLRNRLHRLSLLPIEVRIADRLAAGSIGWLNGPLQSNRGTRARDTAGGCRPLQSDLRDASTLRPDEAPELFGPGRSGQTCATCFFVPLVADGLAKLVGVNLLHEVLQHCSGRTFIDIGLYIEYDHI